MLFNIIFMGTIILIAIHAGMRFTIPKEKLLASQIMRLGTLILAGLIILNFKNGFEIGSLIVVIIFIVNAFFHHLTIRELKKRNKI